MALARERRSDSGFNYWPGFVDALSTLVLSIVFLLSVFLVVQFFLSQEVTGKDKALEQLNLKIAQLNDLLSLEKLGKIALDDQVGQLRAGLAAAEGERDRIKGLYDGLAGAGGDAQGRANELNKALESEKTVSSRALAQIEVLNQQISALRRQLAALEEALEASEKRDKESQGRIADLGQRLNVALAQRVQELSRYRSEFFGRLRAILGNRPDIRIVGDRFVFQSEVFFDTGQATLLPEGRTELEADTRAAALSSWPGTAVRRTASLPLTYARPSTPSVLPARKTWIPGTRLHEAGHDGLPLTTPPFVLRPYQPSDEDAAIALWQR